MKKDLVYAVSNGRQGFFSIVTGKYVPVTKRFFNLWRKSKESWWYSLGVLVQQGPQQLIEVGETKAWPDKISPDEHFERTRKEYKDILDSRDDVVNVLHLIMYPKSKEPSEEAVQRILAILLGEHDT